MKHPPHLGGVVVVVVHGRDDYNTFLGTDDFRRVPRDLGHSKILFVTVRIVLLAIEHVSELPPPPRIHTIFEQFVVAVAVLPPCYLT